MADAVAQGENSKRHRKDKTPAGEDPSLIEQNESLLSKFPDADPETREVIKSQIKYNNDFMDGRAKSLDLQNTRDNRLAIIGVISGVLVVVIFLGFSAYIAHQGNALAAGGIAAVPIAVIASSLIRNRLVIIKKAFRPGGPGR